MNMSRQGHNAMIVKQLSFYIAGSILHYQIVSFNIWGSRVTELYSIHSNRHPFQVTMRVWEGVEDTIEKPRREISANVHILMTLAAVEHY